MAIYWYKAIDNQGKSTKGVVEALNIVDLELRLKRMGFDLVNGGIQLRRYSNFGLSSIKRKDLISFCFHLEQLIKAGVPLVESLADLRDSLTHPRLREISSGLIESIEGGQKLSEAMMAYPKVFDNVFCHLIRSGENSGRLPDVFHSLTETLKWQDEIAAQTKRILVYPIIAGSFIAVAVSFLMIYLVPKLALFLKNTGQALPLQTQLLLATSDFLVNYWYVFFLGPFILIGVMQLLAQFNDTYRYRLDSLKFHLPLIGEVIKKIILARFTNTFSLMYAAKITILDALKNCEEIVGNKAVQKGLKEIGQQISEGKNLTTAFQDVKLFPPLIIRMIRVGENTGELDKALLNVSYFYEREIKDTIEKIQAVLGPLMILILAAVLLWVALAVLLPIYDAITKIT